MSDRGPDLSTLLEHEAWVRRLARALVSDDHAADEVVQQTWLNALLWPPRRGGELRGWLATVVRNVVRQRARGEARERDRRRRGARREADPAASGRDALERLELQRQVARAVTDLRPADREVLVLRYYDDLPPRAIARRLDLPVPTVKSRLARARGRLASRLGPHFGGDGAARSALVWLAFGDTAVPRLARLAGGGGAASTPWAGVAAVAGAALVVVALVQLGGGEGQPVSGPGQAVVRAPAAEALRIPPWEPPAAAPPPLRRAEEPARRVAVMPASADPRPGVPPDPVAEPPAEPVADETGLAWDLAARRPEGAGLVSRLEVLPEAAPAGSGWRVQVLLTPAARSLLREREAKERGRRHPETVGDVACGERVPLHRDVGAGTVTLPGALQRFALAEVFVELEGLPERRWKRPEATVSIDQRGCLFSPRVVGLQAKQRLEFTNSDPTLHNLHLVPQVNREVNVAMPTGIKPVVRRLSKPERAVPLGCDVHPWMAAHLFVLDHPFFAVSDGEGRAGLATAPWTDPWPTGRYQLRLWHPLVPEWTEVLDDPGRDVALRVTLDVGR